MFVGQVSVYSVALYLFACHMGLVKVNFDIIIRTLLPISTRRYWFATIYVGMYLLFPFLNRLISGLSKQHHLSFCIILLILHCIVPSTVLLADAWNAERGYSLAWFITLYLVGAYIRLYYSKTNPSDISTSTHVSKKSSFTTYLHKLSWLFGYIILSCLATLFKYYLPAAFNVILGNNYISSVISYNSLIMFLSSVCLFMFFLNINIKREWIRRLICNVAPLTFGVYLLHEWPDLRNYLWTKIFNPPKYVNSFKMYPYLLITVVSIFICGIIVEWIRIKFFNSFGSICKKISKIPFLKILEEDIINKT
jgi:hypothetical protein